ncbi:30S ribosomal protein S6 [Candidatus Saganbacteria bacterium]|nr:30S ribosomal protein S6 [Candidatus Saganbacteria bacterium]
MNSYELMVIFDPNVGEEKINALIAKIEDKIKGFGGEIEKTDKWGIRKLASIMSGAKKLRSGFYVMVYFKAKTSLPASLAANLKVEESIVRYSILKAEEKKKKDEATAKAEEITPVVVSEIQEVTGESVGGI